MTTLEEVLESEFYHKDIKINTKISKLNNEVDLTNIILEHLNSLGYKCVPEVNWISKKKGRVRPDITALKIKEQNQGDLVFNKDVLIIEVKGFLDHRCSNQLNEYSLVFGEYIIVLPSSCITNVKDEFLIRLIKTLLSNGSIALISIDSDNPRSGKIWLKSPSWCNLSRIKVNTSHLLNLLNSVLNSAVAPKSYPPPNKPYFQRTVESIRRLLNLIKYEKLEKVVKRLYRDFLTPTALLSFSDVSITKISQEGGLKIPCELFIPSKYLEYIKQDEWWKLPPINLSTTVVRNYSEVLPYGIHDDLKIY